MTTVEFLEQIASYPHHASHITQLTKSQPAEIYQAYTHNDKQMIKTYLGESEFIANPTVVVQV